MASHLLIFHIGVTVYVRLHSMDILKNNFGQDGVSPLLPIFPADYNLKLLDKLLRKVKAGGVSTWRSSQYGSGFPCRSCGLA